MDKEEKHCLIAQQILHEGEIHLKATVDAIYVLQSRAATYLRVFLSIAVACTGWLFWSKFSSLGTTLLLVVSSSGLYAACYCFLRATTPRGVYLPGNHPDNLIKEYELKYKYKRGKSPSTFAINESKNYQDMISDNLETTGEILDYMSAGAKFVYLTALAPYATAVIYYTLFA